MSQAREIDMSDVKVGDEIRICYKPTEGVVTHVGKNGRSIRMVTQENPDAELTFFNGDAVKLTLLKRAVQLPTAVGSVIKDAVTESVYVSTGTGYRGVLTWGQLDFDYMQKRLNNGSMRVVFDAGKEGGR